MVEGILIILAFIIGMGVGYVLKGDFKVTKTIHHTQAQEVIEEVKIEEEDTEEEDVIEDVYSTLDNLIRGDDLIE